LITHTQRATLGTKLRMSHSAPNILKIKYYFWGENLALKMLPQWWNYFLAFCLVNNQTKLYLNLHKSSAAKQETHIFLITRISEYAPSILNVSIENFYDPVKKNKKSRLEYNLLTVSSIKLWNGKKTISTFKFRIDPRNMKHCNFTVYSQTHFMHSWVGFQATSETDCFVTVTNIHELVFKQLVKLTAL